MKPTTCFHCFRFALPLQVLTPPYHGWEANLEAAFQQGALEAISSVLAKHRGDDGVLEACVACLRAMAAKPVMAAQLVKVCDACTVHCVALARAP